MSRDPHYQREAKRYGKPVASRELLLSLMEKEQHPISLEDVYQLLKTNDSDEKEGLRRRLKAMVSDGQAHRTKDGLYQPIARTSLKTGRIRGNKEGTGTCIFDDGSEPLFIRPQQMRRVFDGDRVLLSERPSVADDADGIIVQILERNTTSVAGHFHTTRDTAYVIPMNRRNQHNTITISGDTKGIAEGTLVQVTIDRQPERTNMPQGHISQTFDEQRTGQETEIALLNHRLRHEWPDDVLKETQAIDASIDNAMIKRRFDLRDNPFVTIDGDDSKDFDDAVFCRKEGRYYRLQVAIADVSHYVQPGTPLDVEAQQRGNSVYFPREVIPMLPERLSNHLCSLVPEQDRPALVCDMRITAKGTVTDFQFYEAVFRSHARLTYNQVAHALEDAGLEESNTATLPEAVIDNITALEQVYQGLLQKRQIRGALAIELPELRFLFHDNRIQKLARVHRTVAHKIIEEAMLAANVCAAELLIRHQMPTLYRTHENPDSERLERFRRYLKQSGLQLGGGNNPKPKHFLALIEQLEDVPHADIIYMQLLSTLMRAEYRPDQQPHFGLAYDNYCHFTSPIRRYPDLLVHRAIKTLIHSRVKGNGLQRVQGAGMWKREQTYPYDLSALSTIGLHCTDTETRAEDASRDVQQYLRCNYLQQFVGNTFNGTIKAVTKFGVFVEMQGTCSEGLVHISRLRGDYYRFDADSMSLRGERTGKVYTLGSKLEVQLTRVDIDQGMIDLEPVTNESPTGKRNKKKKPSTKPTKSKQKTQAKTTEKPPSKNKPSRARRRKRQTKE